MDSLRLGGRGTALRLTPGRRQTQRRPEPLASLEPHPLLDRTELKLAIEARLQLPVDIATYTQGDAPTSFQVNALKQARPIDADDVA